MKINIEEIKSINDFEYLRKLRNKSYIRSNSLNKKIISKKNHEKWLKKNKSNKIYVIKNIRKNIGYIRINERNFVSWALEKKYWGKIKFPDYLKKSTRNKKITYFCIILVDNLRSQIVALKAGFRFYQINKKYIIFQKKSIY
ncbi:hypothetical protein OAR40_01440 [Candidatus Pelagibacter sp.]|nr:hypothetical protein [Candidatus Pelagibacter sp.]